MGANQHGEGFVNAPMAEYRAGGGTSVCRSYGATKQKEKLSHGHSRRNILDNLLDVLCRCDSLGRSLDACPDPTAYMVRGNPKERGKAETSE